MFPILRYKVKGRSMLPNYKEGDYLLINKLSRIQKGDAVVLKHPKTNELILKRVSKIKNGRYDVLGDNKNQSTDSRHFGSISEEMIVGKILFHIKKDLDYSETNK